MQPADLPAPHLLRMQQTFEAMRAAHQADMLPAWPVRRDRLMRLKRLVMDNRDAIAQAVSADFGNRSRQETDLLEIFPSVDGIKHALSHGKRWMRVQRRGVSLWFRPASTRLIPQPLGVAGIVVPWNYPIYLTIGPLVSALAAGNRAMVKLSEYTPRFSALFADLIERNFAADEVRVINGDAAVAEAFSRLPFDHLLFTGSTNVGHHVMRAAADNLTPVTLELGGKSPTIIGPDADFDRAVERTLVGKLLNAGQTCVAPDYVLLPAGTEQRFIDAARKLVGKMYPDMARNRDYTTLISPRHFQRMASLADEAREQGAQVLPLTNAVPDEGTRQFPPALITGGTEAMRVMQEEIFGPLLPLVPYRTLDEALDYINARPRPLALYLFERNGATVDRVMAGTIAGGVCINETLLHVAQDDLPFGGVGASGMGAYHGIHGFERFSKMKPVFRQSAINGLGLFRAPYGKTFETMMKLLVR